MKSMKIVKLDAVFILQKLGYLVVTNYKLIKLIRFLGFFNKLTSKRKPKVLKLIQFVISDSFKY